MRILNTRYEIQNARHEKGAVLLFTLMVMITLTSVVGAYLGFVQHSTRSTGAQINSGKAFYLAEAGLHRYVFFLKSEQDYRDNYPNLSEDLGDGSYSVQASRDQPTNTYTVTATGTVGAISRQITQSFVVTSAVIERGIHADGANLKFDSSSGTVNGNVSCFTSVMNAEGMTITGDVIDGADQVKVNPAITFSTYHDLADALGQASTSKLTFSSGNTYTGIWYTTKKVTIESNVTINGSIVAEKDIELEDSEKRNAENVIINPKAYDPIQNYPALVSGGNITGTVKSGVGLKDSTISGLILADNNITFDSLTGTTFTGTIIAIGNIEMKNGSNFTVTYNSGIWDPMPLGFSFSSEATITEQNDWNEI